MQSTDPGPVLSPPVKPSDAKSWTLCRRRVWLDNQPGVIVEGEDPFERLVIEMGLEHERNVLGQLAGERTVVRAKSQSHTRQCMQEGVDVIYQGQLVDESQGLVGNPDFLIRHVSGSYQAADAKLALNEQKKEIQVQLGLYRLLLKSELPALVFRGDNTIGEIGDEANKVTGEFIDDMRALLARTSEPAVRYSHSRCRQCPYYLHCRPGFEEKGDTSLLYNVRGDVAEALSRNGISDIEALAACDPATIPDIPYLKGEAKKRRAVLQAKAFLTGEMFRVDAINLPEGEWVHFDIEDNPLTLTGQKHVYLWGFLKPDHEGSDYEYVWTDSQEQDLQGWVRFLDLVGRFLDEYPDLVLAHYSNHESTTISQYAKRFGMESHPVARLLLGEESPLFDLHSVVERCLVLPIDGYGLKDVCKNPNLVDFQWGEQDSGGQWSIALYHDYLDLENRAERNRIKDRILRYNLDDVRATVALEKWLRAGPLKRTRL